MGCGGARQRAEAAGTGARPRRARSRCSTRGALFVMKAPRGATRCAWARRARQRTAARTALTRAACCARGARSQPACFAEGKECGDSAITTPAAARSASTALAKPQHEGARAPGCSEAPDDSVAARRRRGGGAASGSTASRRRGADAGRRTGNCCRVPNCVTPAVEFSAYNTRNRLCVPHTRAEAVDMGDGELSRFCQKHVPGFPRAAAALACAHALARCVFPLRHASRCVWVSRARVRGRRLSWHSCLTPAPLALAGATVCIR
jgi:hypothetical protein